MANNSAIEFIYHQYGHNAEITASYFDDKYIITGDKRGIVQVWDIQTKDSIATFYAHHAPIASIAVLHSDFLVTGSRDARISIWSLRTFDLLSTGSAHISALLKLDIAGEFIYSIGIDDTLKKWSFNNGKITLQDSTKAPAISNFFILSDSILTTTADGLISLYSLDDLKLKGYLRLNANKVGKAIGNFFKKTKRKDNPAEFFSRITRRYGIPISDAVLIDGKVICSHHFGLISIWDSKKWRHRDAYFAHGTHITGMAKILDPKANRELVATTSLDKTIKIHDPDKKSIILSHELNFRPTALASNPSYNTLLVGFNTGAITLFNDQLNEVSSMPANDGISSATFCSQGVVIGLKSGKLNIINPNDFSITRTLELFRHEIKGIACVNEKIVAVSASGEIIVLNKNLEVIKQISLDFRPDDVSRFKNYLTLKDPFVFDLKNLDVIKGKVSEDTRREWKKQQLFDLIILNNDLIISLNSSVLDTYENAKDDTTRTIIDALKDMLNSTRAKQYSRKNLVVFNRHYFQERKE